MIEEHPTFWVIDSTKIQDYMQCPRMYFFKYILGWRLELPSVHLEYGIALHKALEHLLTHGYDPVSTTAAFDIFDDYFSKNYVSICGDDHKSKNIGTTYYSLLQYARQYARDLEEFKVLHTEVAGSVLIDPKKKLYFRLDTVCKGRFEGRTGIFSLEHKTGTTYDRKWSLQWKQKFQVGTYYHVINCHFLEDVIGVVINGFFPHNPPEMKKDGTPRAASRDCEFRRELIQRNKAQMEDWILTANSWYDSIIADTTNCFMVSEDMLVMKPFRKQTEQCTSFFGCAFADYCRAWANPVGHQHPQAGFVKSYWDPREMVKEAKTKMEA